MLSITSEFLKRTKRIILIVAVLLFALPTVVARDPDGEFNLIAEEYLQGYFNWRPQTAVSLGLHE